MNNKVKGTGVSVGSVSLVVIFSILCLAVFSVLSLVTAMSEKNLSDKSANAVKEYYAADLKCSQAVEKMQQAIKQGVAPLEAEVLAVEGDITPEIGMDEVYNIFFSQAVDEKQQLNVSIVLSEDSLQIKEWIVTDVGLWEPDGKLNVWTGD